MAVVGLSGCALWSATRDQPARGDPKVAIAAAFPDASVSNITPLPTAWPCSALHHDEPRAGGYRFMLGEDDTERAMLACVLDHGHARGWQYYPADIEEKLLADIPEAMRRYVEEHRARAKRSFYPDGTRMGADCLTLTVEACLSDHFLEELGVVEEIDAADFDPDARLLIDVRGETERATAPLPAGLSHHAVRYGFDAYTPLSIDELDRDLFADAVADMRGTDPRPAALICSIGMRSRAATAALQAAGMNGVVSIKGGWRALSIHQQIGS